MISSAKSLACAKHNSSRVCPVLGQSTTSQFQQKIVLFKINVAKYKYLKANLAPLFLSNKPPFWKSEFVIEPFCFRIKTRVKMSLELFPICNNKTVCHFEGELGLSLLRHR